MSPLLELTAQIVANLAAKNSMTTEQIVQAISRVHSELKAALNKESAAETLDQPTAQPEAQTLTVKQAFKKNEVICMVCNKGGFKTLTRHLSKVHDLKPGQYRKMFGIKSTQKLAAKSFSEERSKAAIDRGMVDVLAKAREKRMANLNAKKNVPAVKVKAKAPAKRVESSIPAVKAKAAVPAVKKKAAVPAVKVKAGAPVEVKKAAPNPKK